ncbi:hypothetical protein NIES2101_03705 [Calothrix sp. HK-06]|nr:hypothetical protein NIES2101_03705 [Calothrix sp. HK-06]
MSVLKTKLAHPSRMRGIFRYLLTIKGQRENIEVLKKIISPDKLVEGKKTPRPMFNSSLREGIKCGLFIEDDQDIAINPDLPEDAKNPQLGDKLLPDTLTRLLFANDNEDEEDFGRVCAWYLAQDIYDAPGTEQEVQSCVSEQKVGDFLKMTSDVLFDQMDDWMFYLGLTWRHALDKKTVSVPDPTNYLKRNIKTLFNGGKEVLIKDFIARLSHQCPLFETGKFRNEVENIIGARLPSYLSSSTAFALFRLRDEGYIKLARKSDADLMILPKINNQVDDDGRVSHLILQEENV